MRDFLADYSGVIDMLDLGESLAVIVLSFPLDFFSFFHSFYNSSDSSSR